MFIIISLCVSVHMFEVKVGVRVGVDLCALYLMLYMCIHISLCVSVRMFKVKV